MGASASPRILRGLEIRIRRRNSNNNPKTTEFTPPRADGHRELSPEEIRSRRRSGKFAARRQLIREASPTVRYRHNPFFGSLFADVGYLKSSRRRSHIFRHYIIAAGVYFRFCVPGDFRPPFVNKPGIWGWILVFYSSRVGFFNSSF